jgi:hypothetical protein
MFRLMDFYEYGYLVYWGVLLRGCIFVNLIFVCVCSVFPDGWWYMTEVSIIICNRINGLCPLLSVQLLNCFAENLLHGFLALLAIFS